MNKTLAARLREMAADFAEPDTNDGADYRPDPRVNDLLTAADALDRLSAPDAGVGLTRWRLTAGINAMNGEEFIIYDEDDDGEWVRYEDAAAAVATERDRRERAEAENATLKAAPPSPHPRQRRGT